MSKKQDFIDATTATIYTNGQELVTAQGVQDLFNNDLSPNMVWTDNQLAGFGAAWTMISSSDAIPTTGQFSTDSLTMSAVTNIRVHKTALGTLSFDDTLNKISSFIISSYAGLKVVFNVTSITEEASYFVFNGTYKASGTLTALVLNDDYYLSFMYGDLTVSIPNYFCTTWAEVQIAVGLANDARGGNIYMNGTFIVEDETWDLTNISFYGRAIWKHLNSNSESDGSLAKKITVSAGSPKFYDITFTGSESGANSQTFSLYTSREIFKFNTLSNPSFFDCKFTDIIGGIVGNAVIFFENIPALNPAYLSFNGCVVSSNNNSVDFEYNGFEISAINSGNFYLNVYNQLLSVIDPGLNNSGLKYEVSVSSTARFNFYTDGSAYGIGDIGLATTQNIITNAVQKVTPVGADKVMISDSVTGQIQWITITQLLAV